MYVLTRPTSPVALQFLSVSSREHPMDLMTFNSMRQLPGNTLTKLPKLHHILRKLPGNFFEVIGSVYGESQKPQPHWDFLFFLRFISGTSSYTWLF